jgi:hypothetical protein
LEREQKSGALKYFIIIDLWTVEVMYH